MNRQLIVFGCLLGCAVGLNITLPTGAAFTTLVDKAYHNLDSNQDGGFESYEFDMFIIAADNNSDGCMTLDEYKGFSAAKEFPQIATLVFNHFDPTHNNCITVDKVYYTFDQMDTDKNGKVDKAEFENYYRTLLTQLIAEANTGTAVG